MVSLTVNGIKAAVPFSSLNIQNIIAVIPSRTYLNGREDSWEVLYKDGNKILTIIYSRKESVQHIADMLAMLGGVSFKVYEHYKQYNNYVVPLGRGLPIIINNEFCADMSYDPGANITNIHVVAEDKEFIFGVSGDHSLSYQLKCSCGEYTLVTTWGEMIEARKPGMYNYILQTDIQQFSVPASIIKVGVYINIDNVDVNEYPPSTTLIDIVGGGEYFYVLSCKYNILSDQDNPTVAVEGCQCTPPLLVYTVGDLLNRYDVSKDNYLLIGREHPEYDTVITMVSLVSESGENIIDYMQTFSPDTMLADVIIGEGAGIFYRFMKCNIGVLNHGNYIPD